MTKADIVNEIAQKTGREKKAVTECVEAFMETVTEELARGDRIELRDFGNFMVKERAAKIGRTDYSAGSCKAWKSYIGVYKGFYPLHRFGWADINRAFVALYINYLRNHGYMPKVVNKHLTNLKALINAAFIDGVHDNQRTASLIVKNKIEDRDKAVEIYLTETQLQALADRELTGLKDQVRDIFLVGCYTCQRVSDYNNIEPEDITTTAKGTPIIRLVQQKTKTEVTIPILNDNLIAIFEKYGYNVPKANEQVLNRYIKNILKDLSQAVPSLKEKVPTKLTMKQKEAMRRDKIEGPRRNGGRPAT